MPKQVEGRDVLLTLAERLPEQLLREVLPGIEPEKVRKLLAKLAAESVSEPPQQQNLFSTSPSTQPAASCSLYTDGAARGNPGEAGAGAVLLGPDGKELGTRSLYLGQCTNNVAEYQALIAGLELAGQSGCTELRICLDSELIVKQVQGVYKVKNAQLKPLFAKVTGLLARLKKWSIRHVPRRENARADELANRGIDNKEQGIRAGA